MFRFHGGWVAEDIYFLGFGGVINYRGLRIGGLSGIYKPHDYHKGYFERFPYSESHKRSIYHVRSFQVNRFLRVKSMTDSSE
jgi:lariat debranching enzyme